MTPTNFYRSETFAVREYQKRIPNWDDAKAAVKKDLHDFKIFIGRPPITNRRIVEIDGRYYYGGELSSPFYIPGLIEQAI